MSLPMLPILSEDIQCNVLIIGKSGVGKSSFANYLFDTEIFLTGAGKPVTGWENKFQVHSLEISDIQVNVYDSVGLEANNFCQWEKEIMSFLEKRQAGDYDYAAQIYERPRQMNKIQETAMRYMPLSLRILNYGVEKCFKYMSDFSYEVENFSKTSSKNPNQLIHVLFYVINAAGGRIMEDEIVFLQKIQNNFRLPTAVILTNCDIATEEKITPIERLLNEKEQEFIRVCSISRKTRGGNSTRPFGKDIALRKLLSASYEKVGVELSLAALASMIIKLLDFRAAASKKIEESDLSVFKIHKLDESFEKIDMETCIENMLGSKIDKIDLGATLPPEYNRYRKFMENFNIDFRGRNILNDTEALLNRLNVDDILENHSLKKRADSIESRLYSDSIWDKASALSDAAKLFLFIKSVTKSAMEEAIDLMVKQIETQMKNIAEFKLKMGQ